MSMKAKILHSSTQLFKLKIARVIYSNSFLGTGNAENMDLDLVIQNTDSSVPLPNSALREPNGLAMSRTTYMIVLSR